MRAKWVLPLVIVLGMAILGCGAQKEAAGVGETAKPAGPTDADLVVRNVTFVDVDFRTFSLPIIAPAPVSR